MISYKHITKIIGLMMAAAVTLCFWMIIFSQEVVETMGGVKVPMEYEDMLFDTDTPFDGTEFFDALLENEEYLSRYHAYLRQLTQEYVFSGRFEMVYQKIRSQIDAPVETDPTAFYSYEEYEAGVEMLYQTVMLRAESIEGQINGTIPAADEEQRADISNLVDASNIDISVMGVMDMGERAQQRER